MKFDQDFIEKVREANNIVDVIGQFTSLRRMGHNFMGLCPFPDHAEKTASFSVSEPKQVYHCFGCKKSGNLFSFLQEFQGLSFPEAVEYLAKRAHIEMPKESLKAGESQAADEKKLLLKVNKIAAQYYYQNLMKLPASHFALQYADKRGLAPQVREAFRIGLSTDQWQGLVDHLVAHNVPLHFAEKLGLIKKKQNGGYFDLFRERLMFPIFSHTGEVLGFGGRILGEGQPKYLNSPESPVFHKGRTFYGLYEAAKFIRSEDQAIIVEGYMDMLRLFSAGIKNVVATLGTALTAEHARLIKRYTKNVVVLFDGDSAGQEAAERSLPILLREELVPRSLILPDDLDPDDYIAKFGADALKELIAKSHELFHVILVRELKGFKGGAADKSRILEKMAPVLEQTKDNVLKQLYAQELADHLNLEMSFIAAASRRSYEATRSQVRGVEQGSPQQVTASASRPIPTKSVQDAAQISRNYPPGVYKAELYLLNLALMRSEHLLALQEADIVDQMVVPQIREIVKEVFELHRQKANEFDTLTPSLVSRGFNPQLVTLQLDPALNSLDEEGALKLLRDCIRRVRENHLKAKSQSLVRELKKQTNPEQLEQFVNIHKSRQTLKKDEV